MVNLKSTGQKARKQIWKHSHTHTHTLVYFSIHPSMKVKVKSVSCVQLLATLQTVAHQAPPSMGFSRQEYWSGLPFPSPGDPPNPGIEPSSPALQADSLLSEPPGNPSICIKNHEFLWYLQFQSNYTGFVLASFLYIFITPFSNNEKIDTYTVCCSVAKSCPTLCDPMDCSMPDSSVFHYLLELAQIHVHWVGDAI